MTDERNQARSHPHTIYLMVVMGFALATLIFSLEIRSYRHELSGGVLAATMLAAAIPAVLGDRLRSTLLMLGTVIAFLSLAEIYFTVTSPSAALPAVDNDFSGTLSQVHPTLGYAPPTDTAVRVKRTLDDSPSDVLYDVTYTLDSNARRVGPGDNVAADCVVFFGGSFTWGEGVNDDETMPHQFALASDYRLRGVNFGFSGYGPNHMLRAIEDGMLVNACSGDILAVVYTAIPPHYLRSAGLADWGPKSPRYRIAPESGPPVYSGPLFEDMVAFLDFRARRESALANQTLTLLATQQALELYTAIVRASKERVLADADAPFYVLYWDLVEASTDPQLKSLEEHDFAIMRVSDLMTRDQMTAMRIPGDGHPSAEAYRLLGHALYDKLSGRILPASSEAQP